MSQTVGDFFWHRLHEWGVRTIFGYPGDGINGLLGALNRTNGQFKFIQVRHEEMAAFMASVYAKFTGEVGVCMATSGPGLRTSSPACMTLAWITCRFWRSSPHSRISSPRGEEAERELDGKLRDALSVIPNLPLDDVPLGKDEKDNKEVRRVGEPPKFGLNKPQAALRDRRGARADGFRDGGEVSGARFVVLKGAARAARARARRIHARHAHDGVRLHRDHRRRCWCADEALFGTGSCRNSRRTCSTPPTGYAG